MGTRFTRPVTHRFAGHPRPLLAVRPLIVVGVDGSLASIEAVRWAARRSQMLGAHLQAVIGWTSDTASEQSPLDDCDPAVDARATATITLEHALSVRAGIAEVRVRQGAAARVLLDAAAEANMLVIGSSEWGVDDPCPHDSICGQVVGHSRCPVVVVHSAHLRSHYGPADSADLPDSWEYTVWPGNT
jgi:nucleotide-binding universal stress UspA family protein